MSVWRALITALKTATILLAATSATVMMDTLWTLMTCTPAMVPTENLVFFSFLLYTSTGMTCDSFFLFLQTLMNVWRVLQSATVMLLV